MQNNATDIGEELPCMPSVYVIANDKDVRKSLHLMINGSSITMWPFATIADFIDGLAHFSPAPILLDIHTAEIDGLEVFEILRQYNKEWPVIVMIPPGDVSTALRAIKLGAMDIIEKPIVSKTLTHELHQAYFFLDRVVHFSRLRDNARRLFSRLSKRESEVLSMLMEGAANKEVAARLNISVRTAEEHRSNGMAKMQIRSIAEAVKLAFAAGRFEMVPPSWTDLPVERFPDALPPENWTIRSWSFRP